MFLLLTLVPRIARNNNFQATTTTASNNRFNKSQLSNRISDFDYIENEQIPGKLLLNCNASMGLFGQSDPFQCAFLLGAVLCDPLGVGLLFFTPLLLLYFAPLSDVLDIFSQLDDLDAPNSGRQMFDVDRQMGNLSIDNNNRIGSSNIKLGPVITKKVMSQNSASTLNTLKKLPSQPAKARATSERGQMPASLRKVRN